MTKNQQVESQLPPKAKDWLSDSLTIDWLLDSGLIFEINRQYLHPVGVGLIVRVDGAGNKSWGLKDLRAEPEAMVFDEGTMEMGRKKLARFLSQFGHAQMERRSRKLGQSVQYLSQG